MRFLKTAKQLPSRLNLIRKKPRGYEFEKVIRAYAEQVVQGHQHSALHDFLERRPPRLRNGCTLPADEIACTVENVVEVITAMDGTSLVIQGPPGAGKTYVGAQAIAQLCLQGKRVGIMSNSHKAIDNLLKEAAKALRAKNPDKRVIKIGHPISVDGIEEVDSGSQLTDFASISLVGGTVWAFAKAHFIEQFEYLFVDEASQVSLVNLVAASGAARNLVFLGDQMQLSQPAKGSHPGDSGLSCMDYVLKGQSTIPLHLGIFVPLTRRLHPGICRVISELVYEGRLHP